MSTAPWSPPAVEEAYDRVVDWLDGPANRTVESLLKNRMLLGWLGTSVTLGCRGLGNLGRWGVPAAAPLNAWLSFWQDA